ncbi:GNAT family N-acetyltransferase (plasmid) [Bartonella sp. HY329]|uniref:GNAT family N-acetyltransferase n=1 Tax=unclassified Bartonella TaxID=2645622 RepID=UPI0021CAA1BF|nr:MULTISPECIES: GNAT family N-acetyltransferase [unclassified Bartonella]UXM96570.1 GNAT family N-acetyltransferase [Bartonella sp. HY329]UXN10893.1 GNAT family N-acetyltransferase [Bartonella sp. HY328]
MTKHKEIGSNKVTYSRNNLEPSHLSSLFFSYLPKDFSSTDLNSGLPCFAAEFDLLTTMESQTRKRIEKLPFYKFWSRFLKLNTLFIGTTVSEFTPLPDSFDFNSAAQELTTKAKTNYPLVIVKDLPLKNPLMSANDSDVSSNFVVALERCGFIKVEGQALAYVKMDFASVDEYLNRFSKSRRKDFRRKMRHRDELIIDVLEAGDPLFFDEKALDQYYSLYLQVYQQSEVHFDLLSRDFFVNLLQNSDPSLRVFTYKTKDNQLIGYNICFIHDKKLVDKYIGFDYPAATNYNLYFLSWFINLEYALAHHLEFYVAGWTDPNVKASLGAKFAMTQHAVYIRNPVLRRILNHFRHHFESDATAIAPKENNTATSVENNQ